MTRIVAWSLFLACVLGGAAMAAKPPGAPKEQAWWLISADHSPQQPRSGQTVRITTQTRDDAAELALQYQVLEPGAYIELKDSAYQARWVSLLMTTGKRLAGEVTWQADLPAELQRHRRLVRYRFAARDSAGRRLPSSNPQAARPNYAYFVYDGIPSWTAAIDPRSDNPKRRETLTFDAETMRQVQAYHLIGKKTLDRERHLARAVRWQGIQIHGNPRGQRGGV